MPWRCGACRADGYSVWCPSRVARQAQRSDVLKGHQARRRHLHGGRRCGLKYDTRPKTENSGNDSLKETASHDSWGCESCPEMHGAVLNGEHAGGDTAHERKNAPNIGAFWGRSLQASGLLLNPCAEIASAALVRVDGAVIDNVLVDFLQLLATFPVGGYLPHLALQSLHGLHVDVPAQLGLLVGVPLQEQQPSATASAHW